VSDQRPAIVRCKADRLTPDVSEARFGAAADGSGVQEQRLVGNFPQAFSHVPLIDTARNADQRTFEELHGRPGQGRPQGREALVPGRR
jgi:hypothetical protein